MNRLLLVSNRLPITVSEGSDGLQISESTGGLATGLRRLHHQTSGLWLGWPGDLSRLQPEQQRSALAHLKELHLAPLKASPEVFQRFYEGFSNQVLWPLFHYLLDRVHLDSSDWESYQQVNEDFAALIERHYQPGDLIWIHDYHLCLLPAMLRARLPEAKIGFFLHIPFPSAEVFRILPWRRAILEGLLGADLIGFHVFSYLRHFSSALLWILGLESEIDRVWYQGREVRLGAFPMGIDAEAFDAFGASAEVQAEAAALREAAGGRKILLGVDRLDYTKGMKRRLLAVERLLQKEPSLRDRVRFLQIAVPSRTTISDYHEIRRQVDSLVGQINGAYGSPSAVPIHYLYRAFSQRELASFYRAADVALVTPLRDGMNLVAKEFVATRGDLGGSLILSEFAGAANELGEGALLVNPYDIEQVSNTIQQALMMPDTERSSRMRSLRLRVFSESVHDWAKSFVDELMVLPSPAEVQKQTRIQVPAGERILFLDYDGTLVPFSGSPEGASPDQELLGLLADLSRAPATKVHIVSGRPKEILERWFGKLSIGLHAEHGLWSKVNPAGPWTVNRELKTGWREKVRTILERFTARTPGSFIEEKDASLAWHYRSADLEFGSLQARELRLHLVETLSNFPVGVLHGDKVLEIRQQDVHKGLAVSAVLAQEKGTPIVIAIGDDRTDEDLFSAIPPENISIRIGTRPSRARFRLPDYSATRKFLRSLLSPLRSLV